MVNTGPGNAIMNIDKAFQHHKLIQEYTSFSYSRVSTSSSTSLNSVPSPKHSSSSSKYFRLSARYSFPDNSGIEIIESDSEFSGWLEQRWNPILQSSFGDFFPCLSWKIQQQFLTPFHIVPLLKHGGLWGWGHDLRTEASSGSSMLGSLITQMLVGSTVVKNTKWIKRTRVEEKRCVNNEKCFERVN